MLLYKFIQRVKGVPTGAGFVDNFHVTRYSRLKLYQNALYCTQARLHSTKQIKKSNFNLFIKSAVASFLLSYMVYSESYLTISDDKDAITISGSTESSSHCVESAQLLNW